MRLLFNIDLKNYNQLGSSFKRDSARAIIIKDNMVGMIYSKMYDYYKFPGGGIEDDEDYITALIREVKEEAGLVVIPESIREYGYVHRIQKGENTDIFIQDNFYYLCDVNDFFVEQNLDLYEEVEEFTFKWVNPDVVINVNRYNNHGGKDQVMIEREALILQNLYCDGIIKK